MTKHPHHIANKDSAVLLFLAVTGVIAFARGLSAPYFGDDYQFVFIGSGRSLWDVLSSPNPHNHFYRPAGDSVLYLIQKAWALNPVPVHLITVGLHVLTSFAVYRAGRVLKLSGSGCLIAALFLLLGQTTCIAAISNDTISQVGGTLSGGLGVLALYLWGRGEQRPKLLFGGCMFLLLSMFLKESGTGYALAAIVALLLPGDRSRQGSTVPAGIACVCAAALVYALARHAVGAPPPTFGSSEYHFRVGNNIPRNLALLWFSCLLPISSVPVVTGGRAWAAVGALSALAVSSAIFCRIPTSRKAPTAAALGALACVSCFPAAALNHVSELHSYSPLPFVALLAGLGLGWQTETPPARRFARSAAVLIVLVMNLLSLQSKITLMDSNGRRFEQVIGQIVTEIEKAPDAACVALVAPPADNYSVFRMAGLSVIRHATHEIGRRIGRRDLSVRVESTYDGSTECLWLALYDGQIVRVHP